MELIVKKNVVLALEKQKIFPTMVYVSTGRLFIFTSEIEKTIPVLKQVFGLYSLIPARVENVFDFESICKTGLNLSLNKISGEFAVRCKSFVKEKKSKEFEIELGARLLDNISNLKVNLSNPKTQLNLLVFKDKTFFYFDSFAGAKGMPVSSQGNVVLISKNIVDSKKLANSLLKFGCKVFYVGEKFVDESFCLKNISIEKAMEFYENNSIEAVFSDTKTLAQKKIIDKELGLKTFAPLIF